MGLPCYPPVVGIDFSSFWTMSPEISTVISGAPESILLRVKSIYLAF